MRPPRTPAPRGPRRGPWLGFVVQVCPKFQTLHAIQRVVRFMLSDDLPGILFQREYKHAPMQFHQQVFQMAHRIDPFLAERIQTCIVK